MCGILYGIVAHRTFVVKSHFAEIFRYLCICRPLSNVIVCDKIGKIYPIVSMCGYILSLHSGVAVRLRSNPNWIVLLLCNPLQL